MNALRWVVGGLIALVCGAAIGVEIAHGDASPLVTFGLGVVLAGLRQDPRCAHAKRCAVRRCP